MDATPPLDSKQALLRRALGGLLAFLLLLALGEAYLWFYPPSDLHPFLGDRSPLQGNLISDPDFGVGFAGWEALARDNPNTFKPGAALQPDAPEAGHVWLVLGSSFGFELATCMRQEMPAQRTLTLDRRERLNVRMAQVKALLEGGARPGHIVLVVIRPDFTHLGEFGLAHQRANQQGGYVMTPRLPTGWLGSLTAGSRLLFTGWSRLGLHKDEPSFRHRQLSRKVPDSLHADLDRMFAALGELSRRHGVPITLIPIPEKRVVLRREGCALEDALVRLTCKHRVGCYDPRALFLNHPRPEELYVPDGHLSDAGNRAVLDGLRRHLHRQPTTAR